MSILTWNHVCPRIPQSGLLFLQVVPITCINIKTVDLTPGLAVIKLSSTSFAFTLKKSYLNVVSNKYWLDSLTVWEQNSTQMFYDRGGPVNIIYSHSNEILLSDSFSFMKFFQVNFYLDINLILYYLIRILFTT